VKGFDPEQCQSAKFARWDYSNPENPRLKKKGALCKAPERNTNRRMDVFVKLPLELEAVLSEMADYGLDDVSFCLLSQRAS